jgi:hypothetical protein
MTTGIHVGTLTPAVATVQATRPWDGGRTRVPGFGPAEPRFHVRHLVIFRAPIIGYARPGAVGAA